MLRMSAEQQDEPAIGAYKLINYDVEAQFGEDCKNAATSAIALYYKGEKSHFQDVAQLIKEEIEEKHGVTYHVIVGKNFGSFVTHEADRMAYFYLGQVCFLVFKHA